MELGEETSYAGALRRALREELRRDPRVCLLGEEVGFGAGGERPAYSLLGEFGPERVIEMPGGAGTLIGAALGMALMGLRPVVELAYAALTGEGFSQIMAAAQMHWRTAGALYAPLVIRAAYGGHADPWRVPSPEAWLAGVPGLTIAVPSTPYDALGLLKSAIRDNNPVLFLEPHYLYRRLREVLPPENAFAPVPLGLAEIRRPGDDVTLLTWGATVYPATEAAETVAAEGIGAEVIDLRTLLPVDLATVGESVARTGRALIAHDGSYSGGIGADLAARIAEMHGASLRAPIVHVAAPDVPYPAAPELAAGYAPDAARIAASLRVLVAAAL